MPWVRGYSPVLWILLTSSAGIIAALSALEILPNRKIQKRQIRDLRELEAQLATGDNAPLGMPPVESLTDRSIGDEVTQS